MKSCSRKFAARSRVYQNGPVNPGVRGAAAGSPTGEAGGPSEVDSGAAAGPVSDRPTPLYFVGAAGRSLANSSPGVHVGSASVSATASPARNPSWVSSIMPSKFHPSFHSSLGWW